MSQVGLDPTIPVFERAKTVHALGPLHTGPLWSRHREWRFCWKLQFYSLLHTGPPWSRHQVALLLEARILFEQKRAQHHRKITVRAENGVGRGSLCNYVLAFTKTP
jgi:hypothetical protein